MKIKLDAEDFIVEELIEAPKINEGDYTYFWLKKKNWNTTQAIKEISRYARVSLKRFGWAGTKDKTGITKQLVSVWNVEPEILEKIKIKDIEITVTGKGKERINLGDLEGNKFEIIVRDLDEKNLETLKKQIDFVKKYGFPNYFGEQRFGRGNTHLIGKEIIKGLIQRAVKLIITYPSDESDDANEARKFAEDNWGDWSKIIKKMPRWLRIEKAILNHLIQYQNDFTGAIRTLPKKTLKLYVHAYQSYFFNLILSKILSSYKNKKIEIRNTKLCFPLDEFDVLETILLPGYNAKLKKDKMSSILQRLLKREEIDLEDFRCKRMPELKSEGTERKTIVRPSEIKLEKPEDDDLNFGKKKVKLVFSLPSGCYATVLLRELFLEAPE